jgi:hypothetical protein
MYTILIPIIVLFLGVSSVLFEELVIAAEAPLIVQMKGKDIGETHRIPPIEATGTREGNCFNVELIDVRHEERIGTAMRCFTDVHTVQNGLAFTETTFLHLPGGQIVARTRMTAQPIIDNGAEMTHITGSVPSSFATNLLTDAGTNKFRSLPGRMRMSGVMNLQNFRDKNEITFNDIAIVHFTDNTAQIKQAQQRLREQGFYRGVIDGLAGPNTTEALRQYQAKHGLPTTGELNEATRKALDVQ